LVRNGGDFRSGGAGRGRGLIGGLLRRGGLNGAGETKKGGGYEREGGGRLVEGEGQGLRLLNQKDTSCIRQKARGVGWGAETGSVCGGVDSCGGNVDGFGGRRTSST